MENIGEIAIVRQHGHSAPQKILQPTMCTHGGMPVFARDGPPQLRSTTHLAQKSWQFMTRVLHCDVSVRGPYHLAHLSRNHPNEGPTRRETSAPRIRSSHETKQEDFVLIVLFAANRLVQCTLPPCAPPVQHEVAPPPPPNEASPQPVHGPQVLRQLARGSRAPHDCPTSQPLTVVVHLPTRQHVTTPRK